MIYEQLRLAIFSSTPTNRKEAERILLPYFDNCPVMTLLLISILENEFTFFDDEPYPEIYEIYAENYHAFLTVALENGLDPNEIIPDEGGECVGDNIMWAVVRSIRRLDAAPKILKALLEHGGNPNLRIGIHETVYSEVDEFFFLDGENLCKNLLRCWLLLAAYGGDKDNIEYLPLRMLNGHSQTELKQYRNYTFAFETVWKEDKRKRVLFIIEQATGEKVAVNETPFG